jgi:hypothetical protein
MLIAAIKLVDIAARSLFLLIALYSLSPRASGQFGLGITFISLFAFFSGYERYLDLQRDLVGRPPREVDVLIGSTLRFFALGHVLWLAPLVLLLHHWAHLDATAIALWAVIAIGEHLSSEAYRIALISVRHRGILLAGLAKNVVLLGVIGVLALQRKAIDLDFLLQLWALVAVFSGVASALILTTLMTRGSSAETLPKLSLKTQFQRSWTHFGIGLVALASFQIDRLVAGAFMPLEESGIYFRHVFLAAAAYQAASVLSHNRIMHRLYGLVRSDEKVLARALIRRERRRYLALSLVVVAAALTLDLPWAEDVVRLRFLDAGLLVTLLLAYTLRGTADYNAMLLNSLFQERRIFAAQALAVGTVCALGAWLTPVYAAHGLVAAALAGAAVYVCHTWFGVARSTASASHPS